METEPQQDPSQKPRRLLGKPSFMTGVGVARAFNALSGGGQPLPEDDLPLEELPLEPPPAPKEVSQGRGVVPIATETPKVTRSTGSRSKPVVPAEKAPVGEVPTEKGSGTEMMYYNVRIVLTPEELLQLETFCFQLRMKVIHRYRRKPSIGIQPLSQFIIRKLLRNKKFAQEIEDELIIYFGENHE